MTVITYVMGLSIIVLLLAIIATIGFVEKKMKSVDDVISHVDNVVDTVNDLNIALDQWKVFTDGLIGIEKKKNE